MLSDASLTLSVAPSGLNAWAFQQGTPRLAQVDLSNLQPISLEIERPIDSVFDIEAGDGGRVLLAVHQGEGVSVTMLDGENPDTADTRFFAGLLFEGAR